MKKLTLLILDILFCVTLACSQYPIFENFDTINTVNKWSNISGQSTMCSDWGSLCYNCNGSFYNINDVYVYQSPNYNTKFADDGCDSLIIDLNFSSNLRNNDSIFLVYKNYSTNTIDYIDILQIATYASSFTLQASVTIESQVEWFAFQLITGDATLSLPTNSNYVHINDISIDCEEVYFLDIGLDEFSCKTKDNHIDVRVITSEHSTLQLEHSNNGYEWLIICEVQNKQLEYPHYTQQVNNYYRVKYDGIISSIIYCKKDNILIKPIGVKYYNLIGQIINQPYGYYIESTEYDNGEINNEIKFTTRFEN